MPDCISSSYPGIWYLRRVYAKSRGAGGPLPHAWSRSLLTSYVCSVTENTGLLCTLGLTMRTLS